MSFTTRSRAVLVSLAMLLPLACSDDDTSSTDTVAPTEAPATTEAPTATEAPTTTEAPAPSTTEARVDEWQEIVGPADCVCGDGSKFSFFVSEASPAKVMFFLQGGGACFDVNSCDPASGANTTNSNNPGHLSQGIFDFDNPDNPFADYSVVFVPYCTGDVHIGNSVHDYGVSNAGNNVVVHHNGYVNGNAALATLVEMFPDATEVVVVGESAGAIPSPLYAGLVHDELPDARITVIADGAGAYPGVPSTTGFIGGIWGTASAIPDWPETSDVTVETWSFPNLFVFAGAHAPEITFARHDYAFDQVQRGFIAAPDDLLSLIDLNETRIEATGVNLYSYVSPGDTHVVLSHPEFYTETLNDVSFRDWVAALVAGTPVQDVHCIDCVTVS